MHNRSEERRLLKRKLEAGVSIHMPAPRRIGKTWTINRLATDLGAAGWHAVEVDVEGMRTVKEFARDLCMRIEGQVSIKDRFKNHLLQRLGSLLGGHGATSPLEALTRVDPVEFAETLIASLHESSDRSAIIIDEVAYFFLALAEEDPRGAHAFAYKLRALQQRYRNVRWLLTGSIGLDTIARRYGLEGAFVDFETFVLQPFTPDAARSFMRAPDIQQQFNHLFDAEDADFDAMFAELGWLAPYYLKMVANEVRPSISGTGNTLPKASLADFEAAFETLLQPNRRSGFAVWRDHVRKNLPAADRTIAESLLDVLSRTAEGESEDTLFAHVIKSQAGTTRHQVKDILDMLSNDGLLADTGGRHAFRSGLVRKYWSRYEAD